MGFGKILVLICIFHSNRQLTGFAKLSPLLLFLISHVSLWHSCPYSNLLSKSAVHALCEITLYSHHSPYNDVSDGICWNKYTLSEGSTYTDGHFASCLLSKEQNVGTSYMLKHWILLIQHYKSKLGSFSPAILWLRFPSVFFALSYSVITYNNLQVLLTFYRKVAQ